MIANPEILLQISSVGIDGYDFDETFKVSVDELTGKQSITLPVPDMAQDDSSAERTMCSTQSYHESLKEEVSAEKNNLHNFLLKQDFRFGRLGSQI